MDKPWVYGLLEHVWSGTCEKLATRVHRPALARDEQRDLLPAQEFPLGEPVIYKSNIDQSIDLESTHLLVLPYYLI